MPSATDNRASAQGVTPSAAEAKPLQALVLSGGGAAAAYEVGVMKALLTGQSPATRFLPLDPRIVSGTSAGSVNASLFLSLAQSGPDSATSDMEQIWLDEIAEGTGKCNSGAFRIRANPMNFFRSRCYAPNPTAPFLQFAQDSSVLAQSFLSRGMSFFSGQDSFEQRALNLLNLSTLISSEPFKDILTRRVNLPNIRISPMELRIAATNWQKGDVALFNNHDMTNENGVPIIMASSAIPGVYPAVSIKGELYVDGGVLMNTPLKPAIDAGASELHIVYMDPDITNLPLPSLPSTANDLSRMMAIVFGNAINRDIETARRTNQAVSFWKNGTGIADDTPPEGSVLVAAAAEQVTTRSLRHRLLTVHRYHPSASRSVGLLSFGRDGLRDLIDLGFRETVEHSCDKNNCVVLPS